MILHVWLASVHFSITTKDITMHLARYCTLNFSVHTFTNLTTGLILIKMFFFLSILQIYQTGITLSLSLTNTRTLFHLDFIYLPVHLKYFNFGWNDLMSSIEGNCDSEERRKGPCPDDGCEVCTAALLQPIEHHSSNEGRMQSGRRYQKPEKIKIGQKYEFNR